MRTWAVGILTVCAVAAAFLSDTVTAQAQEPEQFVDLRTDIVVRDDITTRSAEVFLWVSNRGNRAAYDVNVEFLTRAVPGVLPAIGTYNTSTNSVPPEGVFRWHIPEMPAHAEYSIKFSYNHSYDSTLVRRYYAEVSSSSYERPNRMHNNQAEAWEIWWGGSAGPAEPDYSARVSVENTDSSSAAFKVRVVIPDRDDGESIIKDGCVNVRLTPGLTAGSPTFTKLGPRDSAPVTATGRSFDTSVSRECGGSSDATGVFKLPSFHTDLESIMTLPVTVDSGATLSEQCLTAEIFGTPPTGPGRFYDDPADNTAKGCLGAPSSDDTVVFTTGHSDLFTWYDCSDTTAYPCNSSVSLELVALGETAAGESGSPYSIFRPEDVLIHIADPLGRRSSSDSNSDAMVWSTGFEEPENGHGHDGEEQPGILLGANTEGLDLETTVDADLWGTPHTSFTTWEQGEVSVELSGPRTMSSWYHDTGNNNAVTAWSYWGGSLAPGGTHNTAERWLGSTADSGFRSDVWLEFSALGTYELTMTIGTLYDDDTTDTTDGTEYTDSGTYTFHVGPLVELEARDGGANADLNTNQNALTVEAMNNGPDHAVYAEVSIDLSSLPSGVTVASHKASDGTYSTGKWDLGTLKTASYRRGVGKPGAATLTLILEGDDAATATATATITNVANYTVCISSDGDTLGHTNQTDCTGDAATTNVWYASVCVNTADGEIDSTITVETTCNNTTDRAWTENVCASSDGGVRTGRTETECGGWFQGTVYDYNTDNNTATVTAQAGTGGGGEGAPTLQTPSVHTPSVGISWSEVDFLYGVPVKDYQVQWSSNGADGWTQLDTDLPFNELFDITIQSGHTRYYRVRAVNEAGVPGPWSQPVSALAEETGVPGVRVSVTELELAEGASGDYTVGLKVRPVSNLTINIGVSGDVTANPTRVTFTPNDWEDAETVTLTAGQDRDGENDTLNVTHRISTGDIEYARLTVPSVAVTVIDDDSDVSIAASNDSINEGEIVNFTLTRQGNIQNAATVNVNVTQRGNFLASGEAGQRTIEMSPGVTIARFPVTTDNDSVLESAGSFTVSVLSSTGYFVGSPSSVTVSVQDDDGVPGQPGNLQAVEGDQRVALSWGPAPVGSSPVLDYSYRVRRSDRSTWDPNWTVLPGGSGRRNHTVTGLTNGQEYVIQVRARNETGNGAAAEVRVSTKAIPGRPDVTVTARHQSLLVTWDVPDTGGSPTTEYRVQWKSGGQSFETSRQATTTTREYTIPNLTNGTEYRVRVQVKTDAGWSEWSLDLPGTPAARPATSLSIGASAGEIARAGIGQPFRVTFTFTDQDHEGTRYGVTGFDVDDIEVSYSSARGYEFSLKDFREEVAGFRYSARVDDILDGTLNITVKAGAAQSTHDGQRSASATYSIQVKVPEAVAPTGTEIWASEMTVGDYPGNARGYINPDLSVWNPPASTLNTDGTIGSLSDGDAATDDDDAFTWAGKNYTVGEVTYVPAWASILFSVCPGIDGANAAFDLYLDDQVDDNADLSLSFDADEVETSNFNRTIDGDTVTCVEYQWKPRKVDWQKDGKVNVRLVR